MSTPTHLAEKERASELLHQPNANDALSTLLQKPRYTPSTPDAGAIVIGALHSLATDGKPQVLWPAGGGHPCKATSLVAISEQDTGRAIALSFPSGVAQPLILGFVWDNAQPARADHQELAQESEFRAEIDGEHVDLHAHQSLTLSCGKASITLTADGQILLKGAYISSHSTGTQRIKGAAVRIN
jgi:Domain of unknown function (DUF6484)